MLQVICTTSNTLKIKIKTHNRIDLLHLYKNARFPMLVDQSMICGSNKDQKDHLPRIHLDVSPFSGILQICIPTLPFDPPMQT